MDQPGDAVEETEAQQVELDESSDRRHDQLECACPAPIGVQLLGGKSRVSVLLFEIASERLGRLVQQVARERTRSGRKEYFLVNRIVAPARRAPWLYPGL